MVVEETGQLIMATSKKIPERNSLDTAICPLCGESNQCAMASDPEATMCWCEGVVFPEELLDQIPEIAVRKTCVCKNCLDTYQESINTTDLSS